MEPMYTGVATSSGRDGRAVTPDGRLDLALALPKELGGTGEGTNPEQLFAAGYAACFASSLAFIARGRDLDVGDVAVTAEVNLLPADGSTHGSGGFTLATVLRVELPEHLKGEQGAALVEATHEYCPYSRATRAGMPVQVVVE